MTYPTGLERLAETLADKAEHEKRERRKRDYDLSRAATDAIRLRRLQEISDALHAAEDGHGPEIEGDA